MQRPAYFKAAAYRQCSCDSAVCDNRRERDRYDGLAVEWLCPACSTVIGHHSSEDRPRPGSIYRCPVCRLELVGSRDTTGFSVAPLGGEANDGGTRPRKT